MGLLCGEGSECRVSGVCRDVCVGRKCIGVCEEVSV